LPPGPGTGKTLPRMPRVLLLAALLGGCVPRLLGGEATQVETLVVEGHRFHLVYPREEAESARLVAEALRLGAPRANRFATLRLPVTVTLHPTQESLEAAAGRSGYAWLRAWARYAAIELKSPRAWSLSGASLDEVAVLLAHELTHCAMYQTAGTDWTWAFTDPPLWFREGMASVSAEEGYKRVGLQALRAFYLGDGRLRPDAVRPDGDPLTHPEPLLDEQPDLVYSAGHHAFLFLLRRYGEERVRNVLRQMSTGRRFAAAFQEAIGIEATAFEAEFRRYVIWRGWRER